MSLGQALKYEFKKFVYINSAVEPINYKKDYYSVRSWVIKAIVIYCIFTVLSIAVLPAVYNIGFEDAPPFIEILIPIMTILTMWGAASLIINFKIIFKSVIRSAGSGYQAGEQVQTTRVNVTHEYGDTYRVSSYTEHKGCIFAMIWGLLKLSFWVCCCVYIAPFLNFKKIGASIKIMRSC